MVLGAVDPSVTARAGVVLVAEVERALGVCAAIDEAVGPIRSRAGLSAGELLFAAAEVMLTGGDFMVDLDHARADQAAARLRAVPTPAACTFGQLARRFDDDRIAKVEAAVGVLVGRWWNVLAPARRDVLAAERPTVDLDTTDIEVYGRHKEGVAYNYQGQLCGRAHLATWAEAGVALAGQLGSGIDDPRPEAADVLARALAVLPEGLPRPIARADSGYHDAKIARAAVGLGCDFAFAVKRNPAVWAAGLAVPGAGWEPAKDMAGAEVAECGYQPAGWPEGTRCIVRRVAVTGPMPTRRSRRRRTIPPAQLLLGLLGLGPAWAYSFILTNLAGDPVEVEAWFRQRARIEERIKDTKLGMPLRHLPSGRYDVNRVWLWAAVLALNLSAFAQTLADVDVHPADPAQHRKAHGKRLRRQLICAVARIVAHARQTIIRPAPATLAGPFPTAFANLQALPNWHARPS